MALDPERRVAALSRRSDVKPEPPVLDDAEEGELESDEELSPEVVEQAVVEALNFLLTQDVSDEKKALYQQILGLLGQESAPQPPAEDAGQSGGLESELVDEKPVR